MKLLNIFNKNLFGFFQKCSEIVKKSDLFKNIKKTIDFKNTINGWDLRKALKLFWKSNPAFIEWLKSPIVYVDDGHFAVKARELMPNIASSHRGIYHYLHMAKGNYREYLKKDLVPLKKYFYVLRPLLAIMWLEKYDEPAPIEFEVLRRLVSENKPLDDAISDLLARKRVSLEKEYAPAVPVINEFIESELHRHESYTVGTKGRDATFDDLNKLLKSVLESRLNPAHALLKVHGL